MQLFDHFPVGIMKMSCLLLLVSSVIVMCSPCSSLITSLSVSWRCPAYFYLCHQWLSCTLHAALWSLPCRYHEDVLPTFTCVISDCHVLSMQLFDNFPVGIMKMSCLLLLVSSVIVMYSPCSSLITSLSVSWRCPAYSYLCHQWLSCTLHAQCFINSFVFFTVTKTDIMVPIPMYIFYEKLMTGMQYFIMSKILRQHCDASVFYLLQ